MIFITHKMEMWQGKLLPLVNVTTKSTAAKTATFVHFISNDLRVCF